MWFFCVWFLSLSIMFSRFIHIVAYISTSFLFMAEWYSIVWVYHILSIHSSVDLHLHCFHFWGIKNNVAKDIQVQVFVWTYVFISPVHIPWSEIAGSYGYYVWSLLRNSRLFSKETPPYYIPTHSAWGFWFLYILSSTCYYLFLW